MKTVWKRIPAKKQILAQTLDLSGILKLKKKFTRGSLVAFNFHRIGRPAKDYPFNGEIFGPTEEEFRSHLLRMKAHGDAVSEQDIIDFQNGKQTLPKNSYIVTFDDGYKDNYTKALPILKELNIPAIFFVPTQQITERNLGWWDLVHYYIKQTSRNSFAIQGESILIPKTTLGRFMLAEQLIERIKTGYYRPASLFCNILSEALNVPAPSKELTSAELMTWEDLRDCESQGATIGSHTHSHEILSTLSVEQQIHEMNHSKQILEDNLSRSIRSIAYPVGGYEHIAINTPEIARICGYDLAFSFMTGINRLHQFLPHDIKRIDWYHTESEYAAAFAMPGIFKKEHISATYRK